jgi:hypothetical protein
MKEYEKLAEWLKAHDRIPDKGKIDEIAVYKKWYAMREAYYDGKLTKDMTAIFSKHKVLRFLGVKTPKEASLDTCATVLHRLGSNLPLTIPLINWLTRKRAAYAGISDEVEIYDEELKLIVQEGRQSLFGAPNNSITLMNKALKSGAVSINESKSNAQVGDLVAYAKKHMALPPTGTPLRVFYDLKCTALKTGTGSIYQSDLAIAKDAGLPDLFLDGFTKVGAEATSNKNTTEFCKWLKGEITPKSVREETKMSMWFNRKKNDYKRNASYPNFFDSDIAIATSYGFPDFFTSEIRNMMSGNPCRTADVTDVEFLEFCDLFEKTGRLPGKTEKVYLRAVTYRLSAYLKSNKLPEEFKYGLDELPGAKEQLLSSPIHFLTKPRKGCLREDMGERMYNRNVKFSQASCLRYCLSKKGLIDLTTKERSTLSSWANRKKSGRAYMYQEDMAILLKFNMQEGFPAVSEKYAEKP